MLDAPLSRIAKTNSATTRIELWERFYFKSTSPTLRRVWLLSERRARHGQCRRVHQFQSARREWPRAPSTKHGVALRPIESVLFSTSDRLSVGCATQQNCKKEFCDDAYRTMGNVLCQIHNCHATKGRATIGRARPERPEHPRAQIPVSTA